MSRPKESQPSSRRRHSQGSGRAAGTGVSSLTRRLAAKTGAWYHAKNPVLMFVLMFGVLMGLYYAGTLTPFFHKTLFPADLRFNAWLSNALLHLFGQDTVVNGTSISGGGSAVDIRRGCDAIEATVLFMAAVLAFPAPFRKKIPGVIAGALALQALNLVRIISLYFIGLHYPKLFHVMHVEVWQIVFIFLAVVLWALWIQWALRQPRPPAVHAPA